MRIKKMVLVLSIVGVFISAHPARGSWKEFCPASGGLGGWWGTLTGLTSKSCSTVYYTWNTTGPEESSYKSGPHALLCGYGSPGPDPGYTSVRVFIPSPDYKQTSNARYYRWNSNNYVMIGSVNQYNSFGWIYLNTIDWDFVDNFKVSDFTMNETKYSKHVDLDAFAVTCP
jgi:hypothetical protein